MSNKFKELAEIFLKYKKAKIASKHSLFLKIGKPEDQEFVSYFEDCLSTLDKDSGLILREVFLNGKHRHELPFCQASYYKKLNKALIDFYKIYG